MTHDKKRFLYLFNRRQQGLISAKYDSELDLMIASELYRAELDELTEQAANAGATNLIPINAAPGLRDRVARNYAEAMRRQQALERQSEAEKGKPWLIRASWSLAAGFALVAIVVVWGVGVYRMEEGGSAKESGPVQLVGKRYLRLPDGTAVTMNNHTRLMFDNNTFGDSLREVYLTGEAHFDVFHDPSRPFIVRTEDGINAVVLGTAFNVRAYPEQSTVTVTVERGKVGVNTIRAELAVLAPAEEVTVQRATLEATRATVDLYESVSWRKSLLIMDNVAMATAAELIATRFAKPVHINPEFDSCRITLSFLNNESLEDVVTAIDNVMGSTHRVMDGVVTITGACTIPNN